MPNPFVKLWKYLTASANAQIDQRADPKIQIAQAIEAEQSRHAALANQAAAVLGNQRQLEMEPTCRMAVASGRTSAISSSVHCQSAAPRTWNP